MQIVFLHPIPASLSITRSYWFIHCVISTHPQSTLYISQTHKPLNTPSHPCNYSLLTLPPSLQEFSRQVPTSEGQAFATRMSSLFIEASAKTAVGVKDAFQEVVERILDTPELWAPVTPDKPGKTGASGRSGGGMPGTIELGAKDEEEYSGCAC